MNQFQHVETPFCVLFLCIRLIGCADAPNSKGVNSPVADTKVAEISPESSDHESNAQGGAKDVKNIDGQRPFVFAIPDGVVRSKITGLDVDVTIDSADTSEGYIIELFAVAPNSGVQKNASTERISLGSKAIFKPLKKGDETRIFIDPPPDAAWDQNQRLNIIWKIKGGHPNRLAPNVTLKITKVQLQYE